MDNLIWVPLAFLSAAMLAGIFLVNQYFKVPGHFLVLGSRAIVIGALVPVMLAIGLPDDPVFYIAVFITAVFAAFGDARSFNICAKYGGGVVSRVQPLTIWVAFFLWLLIRPEAIANYLDRPLWSLGIMAALSGCVFFAFNMRKCSVSRAAFVALFPIVLMYGANMVLAKIAMEHSGLHSGVYGYALVQSVLVVAFTLATQFLRRGQAQARPPHIAASKEAPAPAFLSGAVMLAALVMAVFWLSQITLKNYAFTFAPNPSYVAAIMETAPVWILVFYRLTGHKEDSDTRSGLGIMASAIALSILTIRA